MAPYEPIVSPQTPMPKGYGFLKKGYPYLTALCRRKTHAASKRLYIVSQSRSTLGIRAPKWILAEVFAEERATRSRRREAVVKRDDAAETAFSQAIVRLFPNISRHLVPKIVKRALKKRSGRVGRTSKMDVDRKARLAVAAHVRHCHTDYEDMLKNNDCRDTARREVTPKVNHILSEWEGSADAKSQQQQQQQPPDMGPPKIPKRKRRRAKQRVSQQINPEKTKAGKSIVDISTRSMRAARSPATRGVSASNPIVLDGDEHSQEVDLEYAATEDSCAESGDFSDDDGNDLWKLSDVETSESEYSESSEASDYNEDQDLD